jgi:hypothetical protein
MATNGNTNAQDNRDIRAASPSANAANIGYARDTQDGDTVYTTNQHAGYVQAVPTGSQERAIKVVAIDPPPPHFSDLQQVRVSKSFQSEFSSTIQVSVVSVGGYELVER